MNYENRLDQVDKLNKEIQSCRPIPKDALKQIKEYFRIGLHGHLEVVDKSSLSCQ